MPKTINFNSINRPYLRLIMQDDAQTTIDVTTPTEAMVEELTATAPELEDVLKTMDANSIRAVYDLAARLISCNLMGLPVTVDDLRGGSPKANAQITRDILAGREQGAKREEILLNAGIALYLGLDGLTLADGIKKAAEIIDSGAALAKLDRFAAATQEAAKA